MCPENEMGMLCIQRCFNNLPQKKKDVLTWVTLQYDSQSVPWSFYAVKYQENGIYVSNWMCFHVSHKQNDFINFFPRLLF